MTTRFTIDGTAYDYLTDQVRLSWRYDRTDVVLLNDQAKTDVRRQQARIEVTGVWEAANSNATGTSAAELYDLIRAATTTTLRPDTTKSATVDVLTADRGAPDAYQTQKGTPRRGRTLRLQGASRLDPTDTTAGGDKETIDALNALTDPL